MTLLTPAVPGHKKVKKPLLFWRPRRPFMGHKSDKKNLTFHQTLQITYRVTVSHSKHQCDESN